MHRYNSYRRRFQKAAVLAAVCVMTVTAAAACSSSSSSPGSSSAGSSSANASASPIQIGVEAPIQTATADFSGDVAGVEAAVATINAQGGINGHQVKVDVCNTQNLAPQELACARKLVSDGVVATVGQQYENAGAAVEAYMAAHHVADIEYTGALVNGYASPNAYPLTWELGSWMPCLSKPMAQAAGGNRVLMVYITNPGGESVLPLAKQFAQNQGLTWLPPIGVPLTSTDFASVVASASQQHANWVVMVVLQNQAFERAISAAGTPFASCVALGLAQAGGWGGLGTATSKLYLGATFQAFKGASGAPLMSTFQDSINSYAKNGGYLSNYATLSPNHLQAQMVTAWLGAWAFAQITKKMTQPLTAANVESAVASSSVNMGGMIPDVDFTQKPESGGPFTRVWNSDAYLWKYDPTANQYTELAPVPNTLKGTFSG